MRYADGLRAPDRMLTANANFDTTSSFAVVFRLPAQMLRWSFGGGD